MYIISVHELESFSLNIIIYRQIILIFIIFAFFGIFPVSRKPVFLFLSLVCSEKARLSKIETVSSEVLHNYGEPRILSSSSENSILF